MYFLTRPADSGYRVNAALNLAIALATCTYCLVLSRHRNYPRSAVTLFSLLTYRGGSKQGFPILTEQFGCQTIPVRSDLWHEPITPLRACKGRA